MTDRKLTDRKMKTGITGMSTGLRIMSYRRLLIFLSKIFLSSMALGVPLRADNEPVPLTPDFTAVVVKGGGLWPQLHPAPDGALLAFGYNAPAHTTLPGDVDCWASSGWGIVENASRVVLAGSLSP